MDSLVRLRQLNQGDISGFVVEILNQYLTGNQTGVLTGVFYPLNPNISGYLTGVPNIYALKTDTGNFLSYTDPRYISAVLAETDSRYSKVYVSGSSIINQATLTGASGINVSYQNNQIVFSIGGDLSFTGNFYTNDNASGFLTAGVNKVAQTVISGGLTPTDLNHPIFSVVAGTGENYLLQGWYSTGYNLENILVSIDNFGNMQFNNPQASIFVSDFGGMAFDASGNMVLVDAVLGSVTLSDLYNPNLTGELTGVFYPRYQNPNNYLNASGASGLFYSNTNPSNFLTRKVDGSEIVNTSMALWSNGYLKRAMYFTGASGGHFYVKGFDVQSLIDINGNDNPYGGASITGFTHIDSNTIFQSGSPVTTVKVTGSNGLTGINVLGISGINARLSGNSLLLDGNSLQTLINALNTWTGLSSGLYYSIANPSGFVGTGAITGLANSFYPRTDNPNFYIYGSDLINPQSNKILWLYNQDYLDYMFQFNGQAGGHFLLKGRDNGRCIIDLNGNDNSLSRPLISGFNIVDCPITLSGTLAANVILAGNSGFKLFDKTGHLSIDVNTRLLTNTGGNVRIDWQNQYLSTDTSVVVDWKNKLLTLDNGFGSIDWLNKRLINNNGIENVDWGKALLHGTTNMSNVYFPLGSNSVLDWENGILSGWWSFTDPNGTGSLDTSYRALIGSTGQATLDWGSVLAVGGKPRLYGDGLKDSVTWWDRQLIKQDGSTVSVDWDKGYLSGNWSVQGLTISGNPVSTGGSSALNTGQLTGLFYPLRSNISGYIQADGAGNLFRVVSGMMQYWDSAYFGWMSAGFFSGQWVADGPFYDPYVSYGTPFANYRFYNNQFQLWDMGYLGWVTPMLSGRQLYCSPIFSNDFIDRTFIASAISGYECRFVSGQIQLWDLVLTGWTPISVKSGQIFGGNLLPDSAFFNTGLLEANNPNNDYRFTQGQSQLWDVGYSGYVAWMAVSGQLYTSSVIN